MNGAKIKKSLWKNTPLNQIIFNFIQGRLLGKKPKCDGAHY